MPEPEEARQPVAGSAALTDATSAAADANDASSTDFGTRLVGAVARHGPLCAGVDPAASLLEAWGLADTAEGLQTFCARCVEAFAGSVPVIKPQLAFFERHGAAGMAVFERLRAEAAEAGLLFIADAKRGDIANTAEAYADAWLNPSHPCGSDAVTAVAYLGFGSLQPMFDTAEHFGGGVFVVVQSSNPEGVALQQARRSDGSSVATSLFEDIRARNMKKGTTSPLPSVLGHIGAVVGATVSQKDFPLPDLGGPILAPGIGAQGAGAAEVERLFANCPAGSVLPAVSRSVLRSGPSVSKLREAAERTRDEMARVLA